MSQFFASGGQSVGVSASGSVLYVFISFLILTVLGLSVGCTGLAAPSHVELAD